MKRLSQIAAQSVTEETNMHHCDINAMIHEISKVTNSSLDSVAFSAKPK